MDTGRRGFFKRLLGLGALAAAGKFVGKAEMLPTLKLPAASTRANSFIGFTDSGSITTAQVSFIAWGPTGVTGFYPRSAASGIIHEIPGTVTYIGGNGNG